MKTTFSADRWRTGMHRAAIAAIGALSLLSLGSAAAQNTGKTLVAVLAHADDEGAISPMLAHYARAGVRVSMIVATDGAQGGSRTSIPRGPELARVRADEARCAADALGIQPPILLEFPDAQLGNYMDEPARLFRLTDRLHAELQRLRPDALVTWGPDGGSGHPDHRLVSTIVTQLVRAGAPGVPERLFYISIPVEAMRALNPGRGEPPMLVPQARYVSVRVPVSTQDLEAARRSIACHKTQFPAELMQRVAEATSSAWNGAVPLAPFVVGASGTDLFQGR